MLLYRSAVRPVVLAILMLSLAGCELFGSDAATCKNGTTQACTCAGGETGVQICETTSSYSPCDCDGDVSLGGGGGDDTVDTLPLDPKIHCPLPGANGAAELGEALGASPKGAFNLTFAADGALSELDGVPCTWLDEDAVSGGWDCVDIYQCGDCRYEFGNDLYASGELVYEFVIHKVDKAIASCADYAGYYLVNQCTPSCAGVECGPDGCAGSCGTCSAGKTCSAGECVSQAAGDCGTTKAGDFICENNVLKQCIGGTLEKKADCGHKPWVAPSGTEYKAKCKSTTSPPAGWPLSETYWGPGCYFGYNPTVYFD